jgi:hypothetical protein
MVNGHELGILGTLSDGGAHEEYALCSGYGIGPCETVSLAEWHIELTCAIVAREFDIPAVVGTRLGTRMIPDGA